MGVFSWFKWLHKESIDISNMIPTEEEADTIPIPINRIINTHDINKNNIIIIDDSPGIVSVLEDFIKEVEKNGDINLDDYNVMTFSDKYAPFVLKRTLEELDLKKVDFAIIDIILPGKMKQGEKYFKLDGVDVAILLYEKYGCTNFVFFTGNIISEYVDYIKEKVDKFEDVFNKDIRDFIIFKGDKDATDTVKELGKLFKKEKYTTNN